jgi:hypothetical protein
MSQILRVLFFRFFKFSFIKKENEEEGGGREVEEF